MSLNTTAVRIKVTLKDVKPEVMRRLVVPVTLRLDRLHLTLQAAFGWTNGHLFEFFAGESIGGFLIPTVILATSSSMPARRASATSCTRLAPRRSIIS
ncbi:MULTISPECIES: plasmid pRiA4b ORF-3 family protein [unclassified Bradyrhizobium]|uniref:plasmid pRiA4b ORF-3 family protein n=1 Tax=unclassified Bradyrhizobium TaxID=2631580 RepID=UPI0028118D94|nr:MULTISPECIES: plasmid pRiA4b ORF-3 family protein [unclassified Bradyrhizobium]